MFYKEHQRVIRCRWLFVVLFLCFCTPKHGKAIAFTNAAISSTRGGATVTTPTTASSYVGTNTINNCDENDKIRFTKITTQQSAATSEAASSTITNDSSDNTLSVQGDPSKVKDE
jgi:hypothetical protein